VGAEPKPWTFTADDMAQLAATFREAVAVCRADVARLRATRELLRAGRLLLRAARTQGRVFLAQGRLGCPPRKPSGAGKTTASVRSA
jgi:hypothetical protein